MEKAIQTEDSIKDKPAAFKDYLASVDGKSNNEARDIAAAIVGGPVFWDCDRTLSLKHYISSSLMYNSVPRTREGYYHYNSGVEVGAEAANGPRYD